MRGRLSALHDTSLRFSSTLFFDASTSRDIAPLRQTSTRPFVHMDSLGKLADTKTPSIIRSHIERADGFFVDLLSNRTSVRGGKTVGSLLAFASHYPLLRFLNPLKLLNISTSALLLAWLQAGSNPGPATKYIQGVFTTPFLFSPARTIELAVTKPAVDADYFLSCVTAQSW